MKQNWTIYGSGKLSIKRMNGLIVTFSLPRISFSGEIRKAVKGKKYLVLRLSRPLRSIRLLFYKTRAECPPGRSYAIQWAKDGQAGFVKLTGFFNHERWVKNKLKNLGRNTFSIKELKSGEFKIMFPKET